MRWIAGALCAGLFGWGGAADAASASGPGNVLDIYHSKFASPVEGAQFQFAHAGGDVVWQGSFQGWTDATPTPLLSASKVITSFAVLRSMQLRPADWFPERPINEFAVGAWRSFANLRMAGSTRRFNVTIKQLLTHTSGLAFALLAKSPDSIRRRGLCFEPGTGWSYSIGHRLLGWLLRDYWQKASVQEALDDLVYTPLGMSSTRFAAWWMDHFFKGEAGDGGIESTAADLTKVAVAMLRKGQTPGGDVLISQANWDAWGAQNLLPGGALVTEFKPKWTCPFWVLSGRFIGAEFGQSMFAATYYGSGSGAAREVGWQGFFSSAVHVSYAEDLAFVKTQRVIDIEAFTSPKQSTTAYHLMHFSEMSEYLRCKPVRCAAPGQKARLCSDNGTQCQEGVKYRWLVSPRSALLVNETSHACYLPRCHGGQQAEALLYP